jgi:hypothetical protein
VALTGGFHWALWVSGLTGLAAVPLTFLLIRRSPHAAELLDAKHRLSADLVSDAASQYNQLVRDVLTEAVAAGELDPEPAGLTADTAAELLIASARGLQSSAPSPAAYQRSLRALARVMVAGLSSTHPSHAVPPPQA